MPSNRVNKKKEEIKNLFSKQTSTLQNENSISVQQLEPKLLPYSD